MTAVRLNQVKHAAMGLALFVASLIGYYPCLNGPFLWDDLPYFVRNPLIQSPTGLIGIWLTNHNADYWPLTYTTLWIDWRLWGGWTLPYHLTNVFLHVVCALLIWRILRQIEVPGSWLAALLFALHPVNVEAVAPIFQRKTLLATGCFFLSMSLYLEFERRGRRRWHWLSIGSFALGLLSKSSVVSLPLLLLVLVWFQRGRVTRRDVHLSLPYFAVAWTLGVIAIMFQGRDPGVYLPPLPPLIDRVALAGAAVWFYLGKLVAPVRLGIQYPPWGVELGSLLAWAPFLSLVGILLVLGRFRNSWGRPILAGLVFYLIALGPGLGVVPIMFTRHFGWVADRFQYPAMIGILALFAGFAASRLARVSSRPSIVAYYAVCASVVTTLGVLSWRQAATHRSAEAFWTQTLAANPRSAAGVNGFGGLAAEEGRIEEALVHFERAIVLGPTSPVAYRNAGWTYFMLGNFSMAAERFRDVLELQSFSFTTHQSLGLVYLRLGELEKALQHFREATRIRPSVSQYHNDLGHVLWLLGTYDEAREQFEQSLEVDPGNAAGHLGVAISLRREERSLDGLRHLGEARAASPISATTAIRMAWVFATHPDPRYRDGEFAIELAERSRQDLAENDPLLLDALAAAHAEFGQLKRATELAASARDAAQTAGNHALAAAIHKRQSQYQTGRPFRDLSYSPE